MKEIREKLQKVLFAVENPARYMGGEANTIIKNKEEMQGSIALLFPDKYEIGMSHNGTRILYHVVNQKENLLAELAFAPWPDMAELMRNNEIPL